MASYPTMESYNLQRSHPGYRLHGRTPAQALREALRIDDLPAFIPSASRTEEDVIISAA